MVDLSETMWDTESNNDREFRVIRRAESVNSSGRSTVKLETFDCVEGSVTPTSPKDLLRLPEEQRQRKSFTVITTFMLRGASRGSRGDSQPDLVVIQGNNYVVADLEDWSHEGRVKAIVQLSDLVPTAPRTS